MNEQKKEWPAPTADEVPVAKVTMIIHNKLLFHSHICKPTKLYEYLDLRLTVDDKGKVDVWCDKAVHEWTAPTGPRVGHFEVTFEGQVFDVIVAAKAK